MKRRFVVRINATGLYDVCDTRYRSTLASGLTRHAARCFAFALNETMKR